MIVLPSDPFLLEQFTELRETIMFTILLKDMIKEMDEQPDEEIIIE